MSTEFYVIVNNTIIDRFSVSSFSNESNINFSDFLNSLTTQEQNSISFVDEYSFNNICFDNSSSHLSVENSVINDLVIKKYNLFFHDQEDVNEDDNDINEDCCPFCHKHNDLYAIPKRSIKNPLFACFSCINNGLVDHLHQF